MTPHYLISLEPSLCSALFFRRSNQLIGCERRDRLRIVCRFEVKREIPAKLRMSSDSGNMAKPWDTNTGAKAVPTFRAPDSRRSERVVRTRRASIVADIRGQTERFPCLIVDSSQNGFRLRGSFSRLRRGQAVEVIPEDDPLDTVSCSVVWIGPRGSKLEGQIGVHTEQ